MQSQNLKLTTYTSFFGQCKSKLKSWSGWQDHSTLKLSFQSKIDWLRFVVYQVMLEASHMGQPLNHMLHMLCTDIQSTMHLF